MHNLRDKKIGTYKLFVLVCISISALLLPCAVHASEVDEGSVEIFDETEDGEYEASTDNVSDDKTYEYINSTTNYKALIEDNAGLLDDSQRETLLSEMEKITTYGNVAFHTVDANNSTADVYAAGYYHNKFNKESGTLFLIDMDNRKVYIFSDGDIYKTVTKTYANIITDNVYTYASKQDYYGCASKVFEQEYDLLEGRRIAQPMKYISNALLAVVLALLLNYILVRVYAGSKTPSRKELLNGIFVEKKLNNTKAIFTNETKRYDPIESSSGGGSSGGGGGGGGGGSSGGGGGHSF